MDWICVSPKAGSDLVVRRGHELKLVYPQAGAAPEDFDDLAFERFSLQPMDGPDAVENTARAVDYCLRHPQVAAQPADAQDTRYQIGIGQSEIHDVGIDEIVSLRGRACAAGNDVWRGQRGNPRPFVSRRGEPARHARSGTGMVLDLGLLERSMAEVQKTLDHKLLNKVEALGPPTLENLSRFIWERLQHAGKITRVSVHRDSCNESCTYFGPQG